MSDGMSAGLLDDRYTALDKKLGFAVPRPFPATNSWKDSTKDIAGLNYPSFDSAREQPAKRCAS